VEYSRFDQALDAVVEHQGFIVMRNGHTVDSTRVNWAKANITEYTFYQPSGDDNALGLVKLLFPNKHSVYLHDTPSRYLFNESVRLYSHGCMRVRNPQDFASAHLRHRPRHRRPGCQEAHPQWADEQRLRAQYANPSPRRLLHRLGR
jgi:murein L,D-transpeptidase YcbB/YkuD